MYTVSQKNDTDIAHYNFNAHQPILVIFGRDIAERIFSVYIMTEETTFLGFMFPQVVERH